jgi:hypothetical protein
MTKTWQLTRKRKWAMQVDERLDVKGFTTKFILVLTITVDKHCLYNICSEKWIKSD